MSRREGEPMRGQGLVLEEVHDGPMPVIAVTGTLSLRDVPTLIAAAAQALKRPPHVAVCDVSGLDAPAYDALLTAFPAALRRAGGWPRASLHVAAARPELDQALRRSRLHRFVGVHPTLEAAIRAGDREPGSVIHEVRLPPDILSVRVARDTARAVWSPSSYLPTDAHRRDTALLVTTELVTNAVTHVAQPFTLSLGMSGDGFLVAVSDASRDEPFLRPLRPTAAGGRGLHIVVGLSQAWGVRLVHRAGKTVWAQLAAGQVPAPRPRAPRLPG